MVSLGPNTTGAVFTVSGGELMVEPKRGLVASATL